MTDSTPKTSRDLDEALAYLASFTDYEQKARERLRRESLDLGRMRGLVALFDHPERRFPVVHVAGSKGKGSTCFMVDRLARGHGLRTGRFLSPHLERVTERIAIDGTDVAPSRFAALTDRLREVVDDLIATKSEFVPSFFESIAIMGFLAFADAAVDLAVIEVGLGGRLDATNVVDPACAVITCIDLEHTRILGSTAAGIAAEKAGIVKPNRPVVSGVTPGTPEGDVIEAIATERDASLWRLGREIRVTPHPEAPRRFDLEFPGRRFVDLELGVAGRHQLDNAALAVAALIRSAASSDNDDIGSRPRRPSFEPADDLVRDRLRDLILPGRLEIHDVRDDGNGDEIPTPPLRGRVVLDCAHTPGSMKGLAEALPDLFASRRPTLLLGMLRDKRVEECLEPLIPFISDVLVTSVPSPRGIAAEDLATRVRDVAGSDRRIEVIDVVEGGVEALRPFDLDGLVVAGSVYLAGWIRTRLRPFCLPPGRDV